MNQVVEIGKTEEEEAMQENMVPVFRKELVRSHVSTRYQLPLRKNFYDVHMPPRNHNIVLVDENEEEYNVRYVVKRHRLQLGWRNFVQSNGLLEGDSVDFYPISKYKFKVHINRSSGTNGAENGQSTVSALENPVLTSSEKESLPANSKKRSPVTYDLNGPKAKIRKMNSMVKLHCGKILSLLMNHSSGYMFSEAVDPVKFNIPDYLSIIHEPMDLGSIKKKLEENAYSRMEKFAADVRLTFSNAMLYNSSDHKVHKWANCLSDLFDKEWKSLEAKLKRKEPSSCKGGGQDSWQCARESFQDYEKERQTGVDARAAKVINIESVHKSTEANGLDGNSYKKADDCSDDDETMLVSDCDSTPLFDQSHGVKNSAPGIIFKGFEDFKVHVNGETLDSKIPPDIRVKYYQLCCSQKKLIHDGISKGVDNGIIVPMIIQIVRIADAIKAADTSISPEDLESMEKTLNSCQALDMAVETLQAKLCAFIKFWKEHQTIDESMRVKVAEIEKEKTALQETNSKIYELVESATARGELIGHLEVKIKALKEEREKLRSGFKEVAGLT